MLANPNLPMRLRRSKQEALVLRLLEAGEVDEAVKEIEAAVHLMESRPRLPPNPNLYRLRGLVYLRQAELQNCVIRHNPDCCIFPLRGGGIHVVRGPAMEARASFEKLLALRPGDLKALWLLNIVAMTLGDYPHGVPRQYRLPPKSLSQKQS